MYLRLHQIKSYFAQAKKAQEKVFVSPFPPPALSPEGKCLLTWKEEEEAPSPGRSRLKEEEVELMKFLTPVPPPPPPPSAR